METNLYDFRSITLLVDESKNVVIFPTSNLTKEIDKDTGEPAFRTSYYPIELKYPYTLEELADKIEEGIGEWCKHPAYTDFSGKNTFEEKYYGIKGFKNAVRGKRYIGVAWDDIGGKRVSLSLPWKRGYTYMGIKSIKLPPDADWMDFAKAVMELINIDVTTLSSFKTYKKNLNW